MHCSQCICRNLKRPGIFYSSVSDDPEEESIITYYFLRGYTYEVVTEHSAKFHGITMYVRTTLKNRLRQLELMRVQHPPPGHLNFWRLACSTSLPSGQKSRSNAPPISSELPRLKDKFRLQSNTLHAFQREICRSDTFKFLLKTLLKVLFTNKGEILSRKSVKPCKNREKLTGVLCQNKR